ncbi:MULTISPECIES: dihydroorotase [Micromonospora]|uniref:Allantoinase n=1 Tax=Micromonospora yangpuensis TaxID=683228 RepID=A0A1C6UPG7_9ACTN|nr:dihydroorotase family protein [Micromonospora yangpuensis]GGM08336.1 dihydroorotase-like protein [Micromonospora yangpuensis]SCL55927.1 allantoinase [Micromonospora yangpuensis]
MTHDLLITNARVVRPGTADPVPAAIAVDGGTITAIGPQLRPEDAREVVDARGRLAFPGAVDGHQHWGIYNPLDVDTDSESRASAQGGVTTGLTYMRTGQYYLNRGGSYAEFFPEVLKLSQDRSYVDYAFHLAPMQAGHIDELGQLVDDFGVSSFKIFMFYGSHGLHGRSADQSSFLMTPPGERYDLAHFEFVMRGVQRVRAERPELADGISLSLHCETAEIMAAYTKLVEEAGDLKGLAAYSASRPAHSEGLAITMASYLAHETGLPAINLLHLSGEKAMSAALRMAQAFPHVDFRREVTIGHLLATYDTAAGLGGKVNPPLRAESDRLALWQAVLDGHVDWVVSDHACCRDEAKFGTDRDDVFLAKSGFGGAEYLLPGLITEGRRHGLPLGRVAELLSANPAKRYGLWPRKGDLAPGFDADIVLVDPDRTWTVRAQESDSTQEYTPFEGFELTARVDEVWLRGNRILRDGAVVGTPTGRYLRRPVRD